MTLRTTKCSQRRVVVRPSLVVAIWLGLSCQLFAQMDPMCQVLELDSVGRLRIKSSTIKHVSTSHGLDGIADYITLYPPSGTEFTGVQNIVKIIIMADVRPAAEARCGMNGDESNRTVSCGQSVPGNLRLKLIGTFRAEEATDYKEEMRKLIEFVRNVVLCPGQNEDNRPRD